MPIMVAGGVHLILAADHTRAFARVRPLNSIAVRRQNERMRGLGIVVGVALFGVSCTPRGDSRFSLDVDPTPAEISAGDSLDLHLQLKNTSSSAVSACVTQIWSVRVGSASNGVLHTHSGCDRTRIASGGSLDLVRHLESVDPCHGAVRVEHGELQSAQASTGTTLCHGDYPLSVELELSVQFLGVLSRRTTVASRPTTLRLR